MCISIAVSVLLFAYLKYENGRRDKLHGINMSMHPALAGDHVESKLSEDDDSFIAEKREGALHVFYALKMSYSLFGSCFL